MTRTFVILTMALIYGCARSWEPTPLVDGYQIMVMNSEEVYVADARNELIVGPIIEAIGLAPGIIVVDCGTEKRVVNGFENTVGFNVIDTKSGAVTKLLSREQAEGQLRARGLDMPEMRPFDSLLH